MGHLLLPHFLASRTCSLVHASRASGTGPCVGRATRMRVRAPFSLATLDPRQRACDTTRAVHRAHLECLPYVGSSSAPTTHGDWVDAALSGGLTVSGFVLLPLDDPQIEFGMCVRCVCWAQGVCIDARSWRFRCRVMAGISLATYVPFYRPRCSLRESLRRQSLSFTDHSYRLCSDHTSFTHFLGSGAVSLILI